MVCSVALGGGGVRLQSRVEAGVTAHAGGLGVDTVAAATTTHCAAVTIARGVAFFFGRFAVLAVIITTIALTTILHTKKLEASAHGCASLNVHACVTRIAVPRISVRPWGHVGISTTARGIG